MKYQRIKISMSIPLQYIYTGDPDGLHRVSSDVRKAGSPLQPYHLCHPQPYGNNLEKRVSRIFSA
jgi:hypothetical protein